MTIELDISQEPPVVQVEVVEFEDVLLVLEPLFVPNEYQCSKDAPELIAHVLAALEARQRRSNLAGHLSQLSIIAAAIVRGRIQMTKDSEHGMGAEDFV